MRMSASVAGVTLVIALLSSPASTQPLIRGPSPATTVAAATAVEPGSFTAILELRRQWVDALNGDDLFTLLDTYGPGAVVLPEHGAPLLGAADIGSWVGRWSPEVDVEYDVRARLSYIDRHRAVEEWVARVTVTPDSHDRLAIGGDVFQFEQGGVRVYRRDATGRWRIDRETWSADPPALVRYASCRREGEPTRAC